MQKLIKGHNDFQTLYPDLVKEWNFTKNGDLAPDSILPFSRKSIWWICENGHDYNTKIASRTKSHTSCPYCAGTKVLKGFNDLASKHPELIKEWHPTKNENLMPDEVLYTSHKKVWWLCSICGYEWQTEILVRHEGHNCPNCLNIKVWNSKYPDLIKEWHPTKNNQNTPYGINCGDNKTLYWWKCEKGHEWQATCSSRINGYKKCPICHSIPNARPITLPQKLSLLAQYPNIAAEWHPTKNGALTPSNTRFNSSKTVWWLGKCSHEWQANVVTRTNGTGACPYCSGARLLKGFNDLSTKYPKLIKYWNTDKNKTAPDSIKNSSKQFWWKCEKGHEWKASINQIAKTSSCPYCNHTRLPRLLTKGINDLASQYPELAKEWHPTKNGDLTPDQIRFNSCDKIWWQCEKGHEWQREVSLRTRRNSKCPICTNKQLLKGFNDLKTLYPDIAKEWNKTKNGDRTPSDILGNSNTKVWWQCKKGHEWQATINNRTKNKSKCPYCSGQNAIQGQNDLLSTYPEIAAEWHPTKNGNLKPSTVKHGSGLKVWWQCKNGHEWSTKICVRTTAHTACPFCGQREHIILSYIKGIKHIQDDYFEYTKPNNHTTILTYNQIINMLDKGVIK